MGEGVDRKRDAIFSKMLGENIYAQIDVDLTDFVTIDRCCSIQKNQFKGKMTPNH